MRQVTSQANRFHLLLLLLLPLLLSGCIGYARWEWQHPEGYDAKARQQAVAECEQIAWEESYRFRTFFYPRYDGWYYDRHHRSHYLIEDYRFYLHQELQERRRYFRICMKSKGWQLVEIPNR